MKLSELSLLLFFSFIPCILGVMPGGVSEIPVDDPEVVRLSQVALAKLNEGKRGDGASNLVEIVKASRQVVAGTLTRLTLRVSEGERKRLCQVQIWEQPWLDKTEVTFDECTEEGEASGSTSKRSADDVSKQHQLFHDFIKTYKEVYADDVEFKKRFHIFRANMNKIAQLGESEQGTAQYGITQFSDLTDTEMRTHLGFIPQQTTHELVEAQIPDITLPDHFDWRAHNVVTPVKDQGSCGSCWAFSAIGSIEGQWALRRGELFSLSEQEILDCDEVDGACNGGFPESAMKEVKNKLGGVETEDDYPYTGCENFQCFLEKDKIKVEIDGVAKLPKDEIKIAKWLVKNGPVSATMNAGNILSYRTGVVHPDKCNPEFRDHAVLIVGFGVEHSNSTDEDIPYWIIKNSWGDEWGEKGYLRLFRGNNTCGIGSDVSSAVVYE